VLRRIGSPGEAWLATCVIQSGGSEVAAASIGRVKPAAVAVLVAVVLAGCSSSSSPPQITIGAARTYRLAGFTFARVGAGRPTTLSFRIDQPSGATLAAYRTGAGPHTGVHLIIVRSDLGAIIHKHPKPSAGGEFRQRLTFPTPGRYRVVVDAYPRLRGPLRNFQLFRWITVSGTAPRVRLPPFDSTVTVDGYRFTLRGRPHLRAVQSSFLTLDVTRPNGRPATFTPWFGALAHAIFFRARSLDYFHTHVCSARTAGCTSVLGAARITGTQTRPGVLRLGVLLPVAGTWRLFVQCKADGHVLTAPFTLTVR
jgi:hypothetical protein